MKSDKQPMDKEKGGRVDFYQSIDDKKVIFPTNVEDIPDLIFYFCDKEADDRRHSFCRIPAEEIIVEEGNKENPIRMIKFVEDRCINLIDNDESPGFIYARVTLFACQPPVRVPVSEDQIIFEDFQLRMHLYMAKGLIPTDEDGTSDPFVTVSCGNSRKESSTKFNTLNPSFFETVTMDVSIPTNIPSGISLSVYDHEDN